MKRCSWVGLLSVAVLVAQVVSGCALGAEDGSTLDPDDLVFVEQSHPDFFQGGKPGAEEDFEVEGETEDPQPEPQKPGKAAAAPPAGEVEIEEERSLLQEGWHEAVILGDEEVRSVFTRRSGPVGKGTGVLRP